MEENFWKASNTCFSLIPMVDKEDSKEVPIEVSSLLKEFQDSV